MNASLGVLVIVPAQENQMKFFREDPAGWIQVGLGLSAFAVAFIAFAHAGTLSSISIQFSLLASVSFVLMVVGYVIVKELGIGFEETAWWVRAKEEIKLLMWVLLLFSVFFLFLGVGIWLAFYGPS